MVWNPHMKYDLELALGVSLVRRMQALLLSIERAWQTNSSC
jgi:hypothetical protein